MALTINYTAYILNNSFCAEGTTIPVNCSVFSPVGTGWFVVNSNAVPDGCGGYYEIGTEINETTSNAYPDDTIKLLHIQSKTTDYWVANITAQEFLDACKCTSNDAGGCNCFASVTYAELTDTLIPGNLLVPSEMYKISDRGDLGLYFTALTTNQLNKEGTRRMLCPADYAVETDGSGNVWIGVWNATKTVNADELTIWGGLVWKNLTGAIGTADDDVTLDAVNWVVIPKASFSNDEYVELQFGVSYDFVNDWIERQSDKSGNIFGMDYFTEQNWWALGFNLVDVSDWNFSSSGNIFYNNIALGVFNNSNNNGIYSNTCSEFIKNNFNEGEIYSNTNAGEITNNNNTGDISRNNNNGPIYNNSNLNNIDQNSNLGSISGNSCQGYIQQNANTGPISNNSGSDFISNNGNLGKIYNNSCSGKIYFNWNAGEIRDNSNDGEIENNGNLGDISENSNQGDIILNNNNGLITGCASVVAVNIFNNINNGNIGPNTYVADVTDTVVNK